jgi:putative heme iron utilization protein
MAWNWCSGFGFGSRIDSNGDDSGASVTMHLGSGATMLRVYLRRDDVRQLADHFARCLEFMDADPEEDTP